MNKKVSHFPLPKIGSIMLVLWSLLLGALPSQALANELLTCEAQAGTLSSPKLCFGDNEVVINATPQEDAVIPDGFQTIYVLTSGDGLVIEGVNATPTFTVPVEGIFTIHTLVYDPNTLDLGIVVPGETTGFDVNGLLEQGGGAICASLDVAGARFEFTNCNELLCEARSGALAANDACLEGGNATLIADVTEDPVIPAGYELIYVLTSGDELVIQGVNATPEFDVDTEGKFTIHTLVYDPNTLDLGIVVPGQTTGFDVNGLLVQGGGDICAALDVAGASFDVAECPCDADAGTLRTFVQECLDADGAKIRAFPDIRPTEPEGFETIYVLTSGDGLVIENVNDVPSFVVEQTGLYTIHTLVYDPNTLDLGIVVPGQTTGFDVNGLLKQGGGDICGSLDVAGAAFEVVDCPCEATAGTLMPSGEACIDGGSATLTAVVDENPMVPEGFSLIYVLTSGDGLVIQNVSESPAFTVDTQGVYTIHTLVYDPTTLDLGIVVPGETTGFDVNGLLEQGGGDICAALDVAGAAFDVGACACEATAGALTPIGDPCLDSGRARLRAVDIDRPNVPAGYQVIYVLTSGEGLVIQGVNLQPIFNVTDTGRYTIHTLVYNPATLDLGIVVPGETTGFDVNGLLQQGGGDICAALDVAGAAFDVKDCGCTADAGTLAPDGDSCLPSGENTITADVVDAAFIPDGYRQVYVLTSGDNLIIEAVSSTPSFEIDGSGRFTIHSLVYNPQTLSLGIVQLGRTSAILLNRLLQQGGGPICASLDVAGAVFFAGNCPCDADAGRLEAEAGACLDAGEATLVANPVRHPHVPAGFEVLYVLTSGEGLVIEAVSAEPEFTVDAEGRFTIHTLVYDPSTLDLGIVVPGVTTGFDVNGLLTQGGGTICAALDVAGAPFHVSDCVCEADAGTLQPINDPCIQTLGVTIKAATDDQPTIPDGFTQLYVLTSGEGLVIEGVSAEPEFRVDAEGRYTIHSLVYNPATLDLSIVVPGVTTGFDVNGLLEQGGGDICASLDVAGAVFMVDDCGCLAKAGTLEAINDPCLNEGSATLKAQQDRHPNVPNGYEVIYVLTSGEGLVIEGVSAEPEFMVDTEGRYTIHTLVYDPSTLDLGIVVPGVTTGFDVNGLLEQGGGDICAALDVAGAPFHISECVCDAEAETLHAIGDPCLDAGHATLQASAGDHPVVPDGFSLLYVLTSGDGLVIEAVNTHPEFNVTTEGRFTIHTLVYDPATLDLGIVVPGVTTGFDVNGLLQQGGGDICGALDVAGAAFNIRACVCEADAGTLTPKSSSCIQTLGVTIKADIDDAPTIPTGYTQLYVLTSGEGLVIQGVAARPEFKVEAAGRYTIHSLVYNPNTLDLGIVVPGVTTGFDVNGLLEQGGGAICASLDVAGAAFDIEDCGCQARAGTLEAIGDPCLDGGSATLEAKFDHHPNVPIGSEILYVLTSGEGLVIEAVNTDPEFTVDGEGRFTIHTLVYDPSTLDLGIVVPGVTTGFDVNGLLEQGGGDICGALDVAGAAFDIESCACEASAGTLHPSNDPCLLSGKAVLKADENEAPHVPAGFEVLYVLTSGEGLVIESVSSDPEFTVDHTGRFTIHTLVYDPATLDLSIVVPGQTTGFDVNGLLQQGGGDICAALDVAGAQFHIAACHSPRVSTIFPNPSSAAIEVNLEERFWGKSIQLDVLSSNSRAIIQQQVEQSPERVQIDVSELAPGIYMLYTTHNGKRTFIGRFVKANP